MKSASFSIEVPVLVNHLNYGNHLGYDSLLSMAQEARMRWLKLISPRATEINISDNIGWLIRHLEVVYHSEAFHGDRLKIRLAAHGIKKTSFDFIYTVTHSGSRKKIADIKTKQVCFNLITKKPSKIPEILLEPLQSIQPETATVLLSS